MAIDCTVTAVHGSKPWKDGRFVDYTIELDKLQGRHVLTQKPETAAPSVGQQLYGHGEEQDPWPSGDPRPPKFKKDQRPDGNFPSSSQGAGSDPNPKISSDPTRDSIEAQVRLKAAAEIVTAMISSGSYTPASVDDAAERTARLAQQLAPALERS